MCVPAIINKGNGVFYTHVGYHRNNNPEKSQWVISCQEELRCFDEMITNQWVIGGNEGWGVLATNTDLNLLGLGVDRSNKLYFAKFKDGNRNDNWHGYPADYLVNPHDIPDGTILEKWEQKKYITRAKMRKILRGQPCKI